MSSFNPLSFILACLPHPSYIWPFSYSQSLCSCCLLTTWKCVPLVDLMLCAGRNGLHLHPILCTSDAVAARTPVTLFFPLGVQLCSKKALLLHFRSLVKRLFKFLHILPWQNLKQTNTTFSMVWACCYQYGVYHTIIYPGGLKLNSIL